MSDKLIIGCGYLGSRVAQRWLDAGDRVFALTRRHEDEFRQAGIEPIVGDVLDPASLKGLPRAETVLYAVGMDRSASRSMREVYVNGLQNVLDHLPAPDRLIYVGSTGVYGPAQGEEVTEDTPIQPEDESGRIVAEAESLLRSRIPDAVILRFAGIYGPNRVIRAESIRRGEPLSGDPNHWLNLIHVEDGAEAVLIAESTAPTGSVLNVSDGHPVQRGEFFAELARLLQVNPPGFDPNLPSVRGRSNRRINNGRLVALGFMPRYLTYREGLAASV